jgi:hypothetical protein
LWLSKLAERLRPTDLSRYWDDPVAFVHDCFVWPPGQRPTPYQEEILAALPARRRVSVRGPHGLGKTAVNAWAVLWFALTRDAAGTDWKIPTTASAWRQLTHYLWPEIRKWVRRLDWGKIGRPAFQANRELLSLSLKLSTGEAFAMASDEPALIEGAHADELLYVFDEAKTIPAETFDAAEGAFAGTGNCYALSTSTPGDPSGRFYEIQARKAGFEDWWVRHVRLDEAIAAGRISAEWAEQRRRQWGEESAIYQNRVLGEFAAADEGGLIALAWLDAAEHRPAEDDGGPVVAGVDVAGPGEDETVVCVHRNGHILLLRAWSKPDPRGELAAALRPFADRLQRVRVDSVGIGYYLAQHLRDLGLPVEHVNVGLPSRRKEEYANLKAELYWGLRQRFADGAVAGLTDEVAIGQLANIRYEHDSRGRIVIESKEDARKRGVHSPDRAEAIMLAMGTAIGPGLTEFYRRQAARQQEAAHA